MKKIFGVAGGLFLVGLVAGCHSSSAGVVVDGGDDGAPPAGDPTTPIGFCRGYLDLLESYYQRCYATSAAGAQAIFDAPIFCQRVMAGLSAGRVTFNGARGAACLKELSAALVCGDSAISGPPPVDCFVFVPQVPVGGECHSDYLLNLAPECQGGGYCRQNADNVCQGTCRPYLAIGEACDPVGGSTRCVSGADCDRDSGRCVASKPDQALDQPCGAGQLFCGPRLFCDRSGTDAGIAGPGVCHKQKTSGACSSDVDCTLLYRCAGPRGAGTCSPPKLIGAACTPGSGECSLFAYCGADGTCTDAGAAVGQPCGALGGENITCVGGAYCDEVLLSNGTCRLRKQPGEPCTDEAVGQCDGNLGHCDPVTHTCAVCPL